MALFKKEGNEITSEATFDEVRDEYERLREEERIKLADYLNGCPEIKSAGLQVGKWKSEEELKTKWNKNKHRRGGKGKKYTSGGNIPPFDLRNWKYVEVTDGDSFDCTISLNMLDIDPNSGNIHSLYDRIGLVDERLQDWVYTDIDLPLDENKMKRIAKLVLEKRDQFIQQSQMKDGTECETQFKKLDTLSIKDISIVDHQPDRSCEKSRKYRTLVVLVDRWCWLPPQELPEPPELKEGPVES